MRWLVKTTGKIQQTWKRELKKLCRMQTKTWEIQRKRHMGQYGKDQNITNGILDGSIRKKVDRAIVEEKMAENFS